jgi:hypothetical protein
MAMLTTAITGRTFAPIWDERLDQANKAVIPIELQDEQSTFAKSVDFPYCGMDYF